MKRSVRSWFARAARFVTLCFVLLLLAATAHAQGTGGSVGGSAWGGSSGGSSSSGSSGGGSSSSSDWSSGGSSGGGGGRVTYGGPLREHRANVLWILLDVLLTVISIFALVFYLSARARTPGAMPSRSGPAATASVLAAPLLYALLSFVAFGYPDVNLFGAQPPMALGPGVDVEVWVGDRWCNGEVVGPAPNGQWRVTARTWTGLDEPMVVSPRALKPRLGDLWTSPSGWRLTHLALLTDAAVAVALITLARRQRKLARVADGVRVATLSLAFDADARADLQQRMDAIARRARVGDAAQLRSTLREILVEAAAHRGSLRAVAYEDAAHEAPETARADFEARATRARGRYVVERVRGDAGGVRSVATSVTARGEEGGGFVVLTLAAAWRGGEMLAAVTSPDALAALSARATESSATVLAFEAVWVPADPGDVMSSAEMTTAFPELAWVDDEARRRYGRVTCASCGAAFARELGRCPSCGATPGR